MTPSDDLFNRLGLLMRKWDREHEDDRNRDQRRVRPQSVCGGDTRYPACAGRVRESLFCGKLTSYARLTRSSRRGRRRYAI